MAIDIKGLLSNPMAAYKKASQPGGLLAPVTSMNGFLGDPRVHAGLAIARGESIGDALTNSAAIQASFAPAERDIRVINNQAVDFTNFENPQVLGDYGTSEPNFKNATIKTEAGLVQGRENEDTGQLEILTNNGYIAAPPSAIKTPVSVAASGVEDLGFKSPGVEKFSERMNQFQKTDVVFDNLLTVLDDPNILTAGIPAAAVNLINNIRAQVTQGITFFESDAKKKEISESQFLKKHEDKLKAAGGSTAAYASLLVTATYQLASSFNPDGRISDKDFNAAYKTLTGGGSDKDVIRRAVQVQKDMNKTNSYNFYQNAMDMEIKVPEGVSYNTYFPEKQELQPNIETPDIMYPDMILDINGDLVPR